MRGIMAQALHFPTQHHHSPSGPDQSSPPAMRLGQALVRDFPAQTLDCSLDQAPSSSSPQPSPRSSSHRRNRSSMHTTSTPLLPAFSFGSPSAPETSTEHEPPADLADFAGQSPRRQKHKRLITEIDGGQLGSVQHFGASSTMTDSSKALLPTDPNTVAHRGHRHRRSGAVSSKDLSSIASSLPVMTRDALPTDESTGTNRFPEGELLSESPSRKRKQTAPHDGLPRSVGFSDVVEFIARPVSMVSLDSGSSQSTVRETSFAATASALATSPPDTAIPESFGSYCSDTSMFGKLMDLDMTESDLCANFDDDSGLSSMDVTPLGGSIQWSAVDCNESGGTPDADDIARSHSAVHEAASLQVIDLDMASAECLLRPSTVGRLERRRSGYPAGRPALSATGGYHRRAESAPSLAPPSFSAVFRCGSAPGAFEADHALENVFEEEEEEEASPSRKPGLLRYSSDFGPSTVTHHLTTARRASMSMPCLLPAISFDLTTPPGEAEHKPCTPNEPDADPPAAHLSFAASDMYNGSASSSPRLMHGMHGSSEPSPRFRKSVDDVPSLISGSSGSFVHPRYAATSIASFEPDACSMASSGKKFHSKRSSIISLSRWVGLHAKDDSSTLPTQRSGTTASLELPKPARSRGRLSRMLKFWKGGRASAAAGTDAV